MAELIVWVDRYGMVHEWRVPGRTAGHCRGRRPLRLLVGELVREFGRVRVVKRPVAIGVV